MMLVRGSQSRVRNGDKAGQRCEENGGEPRQISPEHVFFVARAESSTALSMLFIGMYPSSEFEFGSDVCIWALASGSVERPASSSLVA